MDCIATSYGDDMDADMVDDMANDADVDVDITMTAHFLTGHFEKWASKLGPMFLYYYLFYPSPTRIAAH